MLTGTSPDGPTLDRVVTIAKQFGPEVINTVQVLQPQQVMLEVRFIEVQREATRDLGMQWNVFGNRLLANINPNQPAARLPVTPTGVYPFKQPGVFLGDSPVVAGGPNVGTTALTISPVVASGVLSGGNPFGFLIGRMIASGVPIDAMLNALEQKGVVRNLAEPNLVALSGDTASFLAGGEYPIPVPGAFGQISVEFKRYGVGLAFTPTVLSQGLINMKVEPEVSELDLNNSVAVGNGISVPALTVRRASTTVELRDGQSFVIGGLLKSSGQNTLQQLPWLGDVPVLGALFRSTTFQKNESELAIIVTPRLVRPARPGDLVKTPLDSTLPANDADLFLMGKPEVSPAMARLVAKVPPREFVGHVLDLPKGVRNVAN
jgi:pilus assembly protein CpaC